MNPASILSWIPVARELYKLGDMIAKRVRARRAARKRKREGLQKESKDEC